MTLRRIDYSEDKNFRDGETIYDVDGNAYTVQEGIARLNVNDSIFYVLDAHDMRFCFTRLRPNETIGKPLAGDDVEDTGFRTITFREHGVKPSWKKFGTKGIQRVTISSHMKSRYLSIDAEEVDLENKDRPYTKNVMVSFSEACGRELYAMLHELYGEQS